VELEKVPRARKQERHFRRFLFLFEVRIGELGIDDAQIASNRAVITLPDQLVFLDAR
jgi:hypothetical protein